jgi:hypothetical protein
MSTVPTKEILLIHSKNAIPENNKPIIIMGHLFSLFNIRHPKLINDAFFK